MVIGALESDVVLLTLLAGYGNGLGYVVHVC